MDRMDQLLRALTQLGWEYHQTPSGAWFFHKGGEHVIAKRTPETAGEWMALLTALRDAELASWDDQE